MNNSPGWASPGSAPSDEPDRGTEEQSAPETRPDSAEQSPPPNWSKQQPPPGTWSAPTGIPGQSGGPDGRSSAGGRSRAGQAGGSGRPGPGNQASWGGGPGWGTGWAPTPPAAQPGVIPLRPLGIGEILDGAVSTMRAHWRTVLGISLVVAVVSQTAVTIVTGLWFKDAGRAPTLDERSGPPLRDTLREAGNSLAGTGITSLIGLLATIIATGLLTMVVSRAVLGRPVTTSTAWHEARAQLPRLLGLLVLLPLLVTVVFVVGLAPGLVLATTGTVDMGLFLTVVGGLAASVVSIWLWVRYSLASPALMLEKQGVIASMRRSAKLVRGTWWRVLGVQLLAYLLIVIVEFIVQIPATLVAFLIGGESLMDWANGTAEGSSWTFLTVLGIGAVISSTITFPISAGVTALLYMDQRIRREALDLELARAAGLPAYGTEPAAAPGTTPATATRPAADAPETTRGTSPEDTPPQSSTAADGTTAGTPAAPRTPADETPADADSPQRPADDGENPAQGSTDAAPGS
ncbi:hypothetical protein [Streptomyces sp. NPDC017993]|uniref:hypothetical protein n=1 Tax=Streptomyces sp. NPDC017993 TaxID=3365027 RepID=UPI00379EBD94